MGELDRITFLKHKGEVIRLFAEGYKPKQIIERGLMSKKTCYKYYKIYREMKKQFMSEEFANLLIRALWLYLKEKS